MRYKFIKSNSFWITSIGKLLIFYHNFNHNFSFKTTRKVHKKGKCVGDIINKNRKKLYHAGDTEFIPEMKEFGYLDIIFLPIGDIFTTSIEEAIKAAKIVNSIYVIPMHNHEANPEDFKKKLEVSTENKVIVLKMGEIFHLN
jgi:L-ascorbate metabolism protein UlaG (beta-lactamase superfamily)